MEVKAKKDIEEAMRTDPKKRAKKIISHLAISIDGAHAPLVMSEEEKANDTEGKKRKWTETKVAKFFSFEAVKNKKGEQTIKTTQLQYVAGTESSDEFGNRCYAAASLLGCLFSTILVVIGDGAKWIRSIGEMNFPNAIMIVDWYHAVEHLRNAMKILWGERTKITLQKVEILKNYLWKGQVEKVIGLMNQYLKEKKGISEKEQEDYLALIGYFVNNLDRMKYNEYREKGLPIGSGSVESACKQVVTLRLKLPGMKWKRENLPAIVALRTEYLNRRYCGEIEVAAA